MSFILTFLVIAITVYVAYIFSKNADVQGAVERPKAAKTASAVTEEKKKETPAVAPAAPAVEKKEEAPVKPVGEEPEHFHDNDELAAEADKIRKHASELMDEAHKPENRGEKYNQLMEEAKAENARASKMIFEKLNGNGKQPFGTIDLHLQFVADAVRICEEEYEKVKNDGSLAQFVVIVGKGNHSKGGKALISPKIEEWATEKGLKYELTEGKIICELK